MSAVYSYPLIGDWDAYVANRAASPLRNNPQLQVLQGLASQLAEIEATSADMAYQLDPAAAIGYKLDQAGARVGEPRGGLDDDEYRRIIMARELAAVSQGQASGVWAMWLALSGAAPSQARIFAVPADHVTVPSGATVPVPPQVYLEAAVTSPPSEPWKVRAAQVVRDSIAAPYEVTATLYVVSDLEWGGLPGWAVSSWAIGVV